jgi:hypothetical protein
MMSCPPSNTYSCATVVNVWQWCRACIVVGLRRSRDGLGFVGAGYGQYVEEACSMGNSKACCSPLPSNRGVHLGDVDE